MKARTLLAIFLAATAGLIVLLLVGPGKNGSGGVSVGPQTAVAACKEGESDCMPKVAFTDINGKSYAPSELANKIVVVNFWATWCGPCQKEIPAFSRIYEKYKNKDVLFLGVMTDSPDSQTLLNFLSDFNLTYPVVRANQDVLLAFNYPDALPTTFVYAKGGKMQLRHVGPLRDADLESIISPLVSK